MAKPDRPDQAEKKDRNERLAEQLRANLQRRKQQMRARGALGEEKRLNEDETADRPPSRLAKGLPRRSS